MEKQQQFTPTETSCVYDMLTDPSERSARYYIPSIGMLHMHYAGNYGKDFKDGALDPVKFQSLVVTKFGLPHMEVRFRGFDPVLLPNPDGRDFSKGAAAMPVKDLMEQLNAGIEGLDEIAAIVTDHFPPERRLEHI